MPRIACSGDGDRLPPPAHPKVSVIIPCYNLGQYLDEAVESVLSQTYQDFEILVVDDGSTEPATRALLADYRRPGTRLIHTAHGGLAAARNLGIASAAGEYLCALDADDRLDPHVLREGRPGSRCRSFDRFVSCWLRTFGDEEWEWKPERCDLPALLWEDTVLTAALVRREAVVAAGGYDTKMPVQGDEDWDLWLTLVEQGLSRRDSPRGAVQLQAARRIDEHRCLERLGTLSLRLSRRQAPGDISSASARRASFIRTPRPRRLLQRNDEIERYIGNRAGAGGCRARREELATLRARLASAAQLPAMRIPGGAYIRELETALTRGPAEVTALRTSMSWRITDRSGTHTAVASADARIKR